MKINSIMSIALSMALSVSILTSGVSAAMKAVGEKSVPYGTPTIDGKINDAEWKSAAVINFNASTAKAWVGAIPDNFKSTVKVLWDEKGIYFAGTATDSTFKVSTEGKNDGDMMQMSLDAGQVFIGTSETRAIFYSFGCWDGGKAMIQRQESKNNAIVNDGDGVSIKTGKTTDGWQFEIMMSWDMIKDDVKLKAAKEIAPKAGFKLNMMLCYIDKALDGKVTNAFGTTLKGEDAAYDWGPNNHGITLTLAAKPAAAATAAVEAAQTADTVSLGIALLAISAAAAMVIKKKH